MEINIIHIYFLSAHSHGIIHILLPRTSYLWFISLFFFFIWDPWLMGYINSTIEDSTYIFISCYPSFHEKWMIWFISHNSDHWEELILTLGPKLSGAEMWQRSIFSLYQDVFGLSHLLIFWRRKWQPTPVFLPWMNPKDSWGFLEEPGRLQSMGVERIGHNLETKPPPFVNQVNLFPPFVLHLRNLP